MKVSSLDPKKVEFLPIGMPLLRALLHFLLLSSVVILPAAQLNVTL